MVRGAIGWTYARTEARTVDEGKDIGRDSGKYGVGDEGKDRTKDRQG